MLYEYNGNVISQNEIDDAFRLYTAFQVGEIQPVNSNKLVAEAIMEGKTSHAVTIYAAASNVKRSEARKYLEQNGKKICAEYFQQTVG